MRVANFIAVVVSVVIVCSTPRLMAQDECRVATLTAEDAGDDDHLGSAVVISGEYVIAGSKDDDDAGSYAGAVYVFKRGPTVWAQEAELTAADASSYDHFGLSLSFSEPYVAVGAPDEDTMAEDAGAVYIFKHDVAGWVQEAKLTASDGAREDHFGWSVSNDASYVVVGAPLDYHGQICPGSAYVFKRDVNDLWVEQAKLIASDAAHGDYLGKSVSISGDYIIVGAERDDGTTESDGSAYVFVRQDDIWIQQAKLTAGEPTAFFGTSVRLEGDYAIIGADRMGGELFGAAYVFRREGAEWIKEGKLVPTDPLIGDLRVRAVSLNGDFAAVNAWSAGPVYGLGAAYLFQRTGGQWIQKAKLTPGYDVNVVSAGDDVSISGGYVGLGERYSSIAGDKAGAVFVYEFLEGPDCNGNGIDDACDLDCDGNGTPEDCEPLTDCNENDEQDSCDIFYQDSPDCDNSGIPDECQIDENSSAPGGPYFCTSGCDSECNDNGIPDACDVDCNGNASPDDCDLAEGISEDCGGNGIPDECEIYEDCNINGVNDECDIARGTSADCNHNHVPDECEPDEDCNENGVSDLCDLWTGVSLDCHGNLIPDECELADGSSQDLDGNGVPDECECTEPMFALVPVRASGGHWISTDRNEIFLTPGQQVWLHVVGCAWDPDLDGVPRVKVWQAGIDSSGYQSGLMGHLTPWNPECSTDAECEELMGYDHWVECDPFNYSPGGCAPGFQDFYVDPACSEYDRCLWLDLPAVDLSTLNFRYGSCSLFSVGALDDGLPHYGGTLALEVSPDAAGTFTIPLKPDPTTFMKDMNSAGIPLAALRPARITVAKGCCLSDGTCAGHDPQPCLGLGGRPVGVECEGDCNGNGVADACEPFDDCNGNGLPDACDLQNGRSEDSDSDGVPDECDTGACCLCGPDFGCEQMALVGCNAIGGHFTSEADCANVTCPTGAPSNDDVASASGVTEGVHTFDNRCATTDGLWIEGEMCIWEPDVPLEKDVWFKYVPECDGWLYLEITGAESDPLVAVYCNDIGACDSLPSPSREFACSQDGVVEFPVETDKCYVIRVGGEPGTPGTIEVSQFCAPIDCIWYARPEAEPGGADKNRYLSFTGGYPGRPQALRVTLADMPSPFDHLDGEIMWVGPPHQLTEASGSNDDRPPSFWTAKLDCEPYLTDWSALGVIHVTGEAVVPGATYEIDALDAYCVPSTCYDPGCWPGCFLDPLVVQTSPWGDAVGDCAVTPCAGPDGLVDFVDITAVVDKFRNNTTAPIKSRVDLSPNEPDGIIDFVDISWIVDAFRGRAYPFEGSEGCPGR